MKTLPGINIRVPFSQLILDGEKSIETRLYPIPKHYIGKEMYLIETPGKVGRFKARIIGIVVFGESFEYEGKAHFVKDIGKHLVDRKSEFSWKDQKKWGWPILKVERFSTPVLAPGKRGIRYTKTISI